MVEIDELREVEKKRQIWLREHIEMVVKNERVKELIVELNNTDLEIIRLAKLMATCKPDTVKLSSLIYQINEVIELRAELSIEIEN